MEDFNLHLTGDVHAIGAAHNLAARLPRQHLHHRNPLGIDPLGDPLAARRRHQRPGAAAVVIGLGGRENGIPRETEFVITVASEVMAVLALAHRPPRPARAARPDRPGDDARTARPVTAEDLGSPAR